MAECCHLVGNFPITAHGVISVSSRGNTPFQYINAGGSEVAVIEPSTGTVSVTAYASDIKHRGCPGTATVQIDWIRRSDCGRLIFLFSGNGRATITGDVSNLARFPRLNAVSNPIAEYRVVEASASSSPAALYTDDIQHDGIGLVYTGFPWYINTRDESTCKINLTEYGLGGYGVCYLQSLSLQTNPGRLPTVTLNFIYNIS